MCAVVNAGGLSLKPFIGRAGRTGDMEGVTMDRLVTIVGGSGFLGRYIVQELAAQGVRVRVAVRNPQRALFLKPLGQLGQVQVAAADIRNPKSLAAAVRGADGVVNLVGILAEGGGRGFDQIHAQGAGNVARAAAEAGARAMVHVSAIGADAQSPSGYGRSKAKGEAAVMAAFPGATILRPSIVFGPEDQFINRFAGLAGSPFFVPVVSGGTRFQPVHVVDVARAAVMALHEPGRFGGRTFELGGPKTYSLREIQAWIAQEIRTTKPLVDIPDLAVRLMAKAGDLVPGVPINSDQLAMLGRDNVVAEGAAGFEAFGISPSPMEAVAAAYLVRYRKAGRFNETPAAA